MALPARAPHRGPAACSARRRSHSALRANNNHAGPGPFHSSTPNDDGPASSGRPVVFGHGRGRMSGVQDPRHCLQVLFTSSRLAGGARARPARCLPLPVGSGPSRLASCTHTRHVTCQLFATTACQGFGSSGGFSAQRGAAASGGRRAGAAHSAQDRRPVSLGKRGPSARWRRISRYANRRPCKPPRGPPCCQPAGLASPAGKALVVLLVTGSVRHRPAGRPLLALPQLPPRARPSCARP